MHLKRRFAVTMLIAAAVTAPTAALAVVVSVPDASTMSETPTPPAPTICPTPATTPAPTPCPTPIPEPVSDATEAVVEAASEVVETVSDAADPEPSGEPSPEPSGEPSPEPSGEPSPEPSSSPTVEPSDEEQEESHGSVSERPGAQSPVPTPMPPTSATATEAASGAGVTTSVPVTTGSPVTTGAGTGPESATVTAAGGEVNPVMAPAATAAGSGTTPGGLPRLSGAGRSWMASSLAPYLQTVAAPLVAGPEEASFAEPPLPMAADPDVEVPLAAPGGHGRPPAVVRDEVPADASRLVPAVLLSLGVLAAGLTWLRETKRAERIDADGATQAQRLLAPPSTPLAAVPIIQTRAAPTAEQPRKPASPTAAVRTGGSPPASKIVPATLLGLGLLAVAVSWRAQGRRIPRMTAGAS